MPGLVRTSAACFHSWVSKTSMAGNKPGHVAKYAVEWSACYAAAASGLRTSRA
jgi:hypothetical protein